MIASPPSLDVRSPGNPGVSSRAPHAALVHRIHRDPRLGAAHVRSLPLDGPRRHPYAGGALRPYVLALALARTSLAACARTDPEALPNVRLGMSPRDVRDRFDPGGPGKEAGAWQTRVGTGDDTVLEWSARDATTKVEQARFEFHLGMLVAVRAKLRDGSGAERIEATPKTVLVRRPAGPGETELMLLARDCPTHHEEAESLASRAR
jgi:hypothetical protein